MSVADSETLIRHAPADQRLKPGPDHGRTGGGSAAPMPLQYRPDIDGLRAVAVILVVLFHFGVKGFSGGYIGVDVFFVISGFLITSLIHDEIVQGRFSFARFYERRIRRIIPALFVVVAASFIAGWFILLPWDYDNFARSALATVTFVSNIWFWHETEDYFSRAGEYAPLLHTWSLAVEEQFYIVFPPLLILLARLLRPRRLMALVAAICAVSFVYSAFLVAHQPEAAFFLSPGRAWELGLGALLALGLAPRLGNDWLREALAVAGLAAIVAAAVLFRHGTPFPGYAALAPCLGAAALIHTGVRGPGQRQTWVARTLSLRPVVFVGLISYSLYLWHWPILVFLRHVFADPVLPARVTLLAAGASGAAAVLSWLFVERPLRARGRIRRREVFVAWGAASVVIGCLALSICLTDGMRGRAMSPAALVADAATRDRNPRTDECFEADPKAGLCTFGAADKAKADLLFWGDSHANSLLPGMDVAARAINRSGVFAALGGCPPLLDFMSDDGDAALKCKRFNDAVMAELKNRGDIRTVVLTARWVAYVEGKGRNKEAADPAASFQSAVMRTVETIRASGRSVLILGDVPDVGWDVPRRIIAAERWNLPLPPVPDLAAARALNADAAQALAAAARRPGVRFVPLIDALCRPQCVVTEDDGRPIFSDTDHLTASAARDLLAPVLIEALTGQQVPALGDH